MPIRKRSGNLFNDSRINIRPVNVKETDNKKSNFTTKKGMAIFIIELCGQSERNSINEILDVLKLPDGYVEYYVHFMDQDHPLNDTVVVGPRSPHDVRSYFLTMDWFCWLGDFKFNLMLIVNLMIIKSDQVQK